MGVQKTGLAGMMRAEMQRRRKPWRPVEIAEALGIEPGPERERVARSLNDFVRRGEARIVGKDGRGGLYLYNQAYKPAGQPSDLKRKIVKAIYVSGTCTSAEIERLAGCSRSHVQKTIKSLVNAGLVESVGQKKREKYYGLETVYRVIDRDRFRREAM